MLHVLNSIRSFDCPRTCPTYERRDFCRFNALFAMIGITALVNSHTAKVRVTYTDEDALRKAVESLGGKMLGRGNHHLFDGNYLGLGFTLPGWQYPLVLSDGTLKFDDYNGRWGDRKMIDRLTDRYVLQSAVVAAENLGWITEQVDGKLRIYHPSGGFIDVDGTAIEASQFQGQDCHAAVAALGLNLEEVVLKHEAGIATDLDVGQM